VNLIYLQEIIMTDTSQVPFLAPGMSAHPNGTASRRELTPVLMTVTPEKAREWTARNTSNRPLRVQFVAQLARDMKAGNWDVNGETVKIADDGTLLDGQHRLYACIRAEVPFDTFVITGLPREVQRTMDAGAKRKVSDHLALAGEKNAAALAAVARWALIWTRGGRGRVGGDMEPTHAELLAFIDAEPRLRDASDFAIRARSDLRSVRPSVFGLSWLIFTGINDIEAQVFFDRVRDGADISVGHPVHTLRARIWRAREMEERLTEHEQLALFVMAWNHFRAGSSVARLQLPKGGLNAKNFPAPK
jgi:hypothetical protein